MSSPSQLRIAFAGAPGTGKTTAAGFSSKGPAISFATPVQRVASELFCLDMQFFTDGRLRHKIIPEYKVTGDALEERVRQLFRVIPGLPLTHPDYWIHRMLCRLAERWDERTIAIDDVTDQGQADELSARGFKVFKIVRPGYSTVPEIETREGIIVNDGTVEQLHAKVNKAMLSSSSFS